MTDNMPFTQALILRQVKSNSGVIGKLLALEGNGFNRFGLTMELPDGSREGVIYRVQSDLEDLTLMYRDHKEDIDADDPVLNGAPTYKRENLPDDFWLERF